MPVRRTRLGVDRTEPQAQIGSDVIHALIFAPLAGATVILAPYFSYNPRPGFASGTILAAIIAAMCYAAEAVLVLPVMLVWPAARRPSLPIAAVWGSVAACVASLAVDRPHLRVFVGFGPAGAVAGLVYALLVSRTTALNQTSKLKAVLLCLVLASATQELGKPPTAEVQTVDLIRLDGRVNEVDLVSSSLVEESLQGLGGSRISIRRFVVAADEDPVAIKGGYTVWKMKSGTPTPVT